jgi:hypothetical protein
VCPSKRFFSPHGLRVPDWPIPSAGFASDQHMIPLFETMALEAVSEGKQVTNEVAHRALRIWSTAALTASIAS